MLTALVAWRHGRLPMSRPPVCCSDPVIKQADHDRFTNSDITVYTAARMVNVLWPHLQHLRYRIMKRVQMLESGIYL